MDVSLDKKETLPKPEIDLEKEIEAEVITMSGITSKIILAIMKLS